MSSLNNINNTSLGTDHEEHSKFTKTQQTIKLTKEVYVNKTTNEFIDRAFIELYKTETAVSIEKFFDIYRYLFYKLPKEGKKSHYNLIRRSKDYINNYYDPLDKQIKELLAKIERLDVVFFEKQNRRNEEHLFYPNRTFIKSSVTNPDGLPIWVMQDGAKRRIKDYKTFQTLKRAFGHLINTPDNIVVEELDASTLDEILDGPDIESDKDLNTQEFDAVDLEFNLNDLVEPGYIKATITCLEGVEDPTGFAPKFAYYEPRYDECYYGVLAYNLGSDNTDAYGNLADQYEDDSGPGTPRVSTTNLNPGSSHTRFFRKQSKWHWTLDRHRGHIGVEVIEDSNRAELGCCGAPAKKEGGAGEKWRDSGGNVVRRYFDLPGWPIDLKEFEPSKYGTKMINDLTRATDMSKWLPYAWHGKEMPMKFGGWDGGGEGTKWLKWNVLNDWDNHYYDNTTDWGTYMKTIQPTFEPISGLGKYGGVYGMPIVGMYNTYLPHSHHMGGNWRYAMPIMDNNKKVFGKKYSSRFLVPLGRSTLHHVNIGGHTFGDYQYWFLPVDARWTGAIKPIGIPSSMLHHYTGNRDFSRSEKLYKLCWLAYPGFDNWSYIGWNSGGGQFVGKGNRKSLI